ncbi:sensor histidine kinase [Beijerinckia indica]|nr:HAMP domain-containing sensor histidine kinase [Beijerinckia indica]
MTSVSPDHIAEATAHEPRAHKALRIGLTTRGLLLIMIFVFIGETLIFLPALSTWRDGWLRNRLSAAYTAALVLDASPRAMTPANLSQELLDSVGARIIVLKSHGTKRMLAAAQLPLEVDETYDLRHTDLLTSIRATMRALLARPDRVLTIVGDAPMGGDAIEVTMDEAKMKRVFSDYSLRVLTITLTLCILVGGMAAIAIQSFILNPVRRLTESLVDFAQNPEDRSRIIQASGHNHEIGQAEVALANMQDRLARELNQKKHLAALGLAVAKINHDLRNMLFSAQLLSDRLGDVPDPLAQRLAPKLVATLDRAIRFCQTTLAYGRAVDDPPQPQLVSLHQIVAEAIETVTLSMPCKVRFINGVEPDFEVVADGEQIFRVLMNLVRNGAEALTSVEATLGRDPYIMVKAWREDNHVMIDVADNGPGVPNRARADLFVAFFNSTRAGGSGLGLVIAADLVRAHGGTISLLPDAMTGGIGATFRIALPDLMETTTVRM